MNPRIQSACGSTDRDTTRRYNPKVQQIGQINHDKGRPAWLESQCKAVTHSFPKLIRILLDRLQIPKLSARISRRTPTTDGNEISVENKAEVDLVFFGFLVNVCSNRAYLLYSPHFCMLTDKLSVFSPLPFLPCPLQWTPLVPSDSSNPDGSKDATVRRVAALPTLQVQDPGFN